MSYNLHKWTFNTSMFSLYLQAYDQVDVYETTDLPESEQFQLYPEVQY